MKIDARPLYLALPLALAACGAGPGVGPSDVQAFDGTAQTISATATSYGTQAAGMTSTTQCTGVQGAYDAQVRPMVSQMQGMGIAMDGQMGAMGRMADGDMECTANAMMAELDRHGAAACGSTTGVAADVAEAQRHVAAMTRWAAHEQDRAQEMGSMMGMSGMMGGSGRMGGSGGVAAGSGLCVQNPDGSYTFQP